MSHSRSSFRGRRPRFKTSARHTTKRSRGEQIDAARFINKAAATVSAAPFVPEHQFADFGLDARLQRAVAARGFTAPTPIQDQAIPAGLAGRDVVGVANTGTGKTAAFLVPLINKVLLGKNEQVLIVAPTRELAIQIDQEFKALVAGLRLWSVCAVGGAPIGRQISDLRRQYSFVIGTPGRLKDLIERRHLNLSYFATIVLDEADRMLDMGFIADMRFLMSQMPTTRQTLLFSATVAGEISKLIKEFLREPVTISVKTRDTAASVDQDVVRLQPGQIKIEVLHDLLTNPEFDKVLIFGRTKRGVERLSISLAERGFKVESIHGDKNHSKRQRALHSFKENQVKVLVATDVAARGLDIPNVSHVINYDLPETYTDYVHRIGRTGRGDRTGKALTFLE